MAKDSICKANLAIAIAVTFLLAAWTGRAHAVQKAQLTGYWIYNARKSDDSARKVEAAQIESEAGVNESHGGGADPTAGTMGPAGGAGNVGGPYPTIGGMGAGPVGMGGMGGAGISRQGTRGPEISSEQWMRLQANPKYLQIDQSPDQVVVSNDLAETHTFYLNGKKHEEKDVDGKRIFTKGRWDNDSFVAETKLNRAQKLTETYQLSDDGKILTVTSAFEDTSLSAPVTIRRVYDAGKEPPK